MGLPCFQVNVALLHFRFGLSLDSGSPAIILLNYCVLLTTLLLFMIDVCTAFILVSQHHNRTLTATKSLPSE